MKKFFTALALVAATLASASAIEHTISVVKTDIAESVRLGGRQARHIKRLPSDVVRNFGINRSKALNMGGVTLNPKFNSNTPWKASNTEGFILFENFSGWNQENPFWIPEGWTVEHLGECSLEESWRPFAYRMGYPMPVDGDSYYGIFYSEEEQNEWFVSPQIEIGKNMELSYWLYFEPSYFFDLDNDKVDWNNFEFIEKVIINDLQVLVKEEGGEWKVIYDYAEEYSKYSLKEMAEMTSYQLQKQALSLADFSDKKVQIAFRLYGHDGNVIFVDAIGVGLPSIDDLSYQSPTNTLYFGFSNNSDMEYLRSDYAMYPVYAPLTWSNLSEANANFSWLYTDPVTHEEALSNDKSELTVEYMPDYTSPATLKNNLFDPPTLRAEVEGMAPASYSAPYKKFQAGGKSVMMTPYGDLDLTLFQFAPDRQGFTRISIMDDKLGAYSVPVFGHNEFTNAYWLNYSLNGFEAMDGNFSHLIGIGNLFYASEYAPLVVNGMSVYGWGKIGDDALLTATIYAINSDWSSDYNTFTKVASATIKGSEVQANFDKNSKDYLFLPFHFDEPAIVQASEEHPAFVMMFEGFNSDKVEYFAPLQSKDNSDSDPSVAYMLNEINLGGHIERDTYFSFKRIVYQEDGEYINPGGAFAIGLDAEYPWLTSAVDAVEMTAEQSEVAVALGSYYDGSRLRVEVPEGLVASVSGRYNECVLTIARADDSGVAVEGDVVVKGPGVEVTVAVKAAEANAVAAVGSSVSVAGIYDLSGRLVQSIDAKGIYLVKDASGAVRKVYVK